MTKTGHPHPPSASPVTAITALCLDFGFILVPPLWGAACGERWGQMTGYRMARRGVLGLVVGGVAALLSGCGLFGGNSYRFRMTVEVETPDGVKTGSSVYEVDTEKKSTFMTGNDRSKSLKGEAVAVDLPSGRTLFALLKTANSKRDDLALMSMAALDPAFRNDWIESAGRISSSDGITSPAEVRAADYPLLVTFADPADPTSVQRVDPANLAASFGPGVTLKRITVEVTNDPVTTGIEKRLGWLLDKNRKRFGPDTKPAGIPLGNYSGLFSTEITR